MRRLTGALRLTVRPSRSRAGGAGIRLLVGASLIAVVITSGLWPSTPQPVEAADTRPNIILISTDDMSETDLRWMPQTRRLLGANGVTMRDFISNHPYCCPARAELLTGQYAQHNGVHTNKAPYGGYGALSHRFNHVGAWLQSAGYRTAMVGKFLNRWELARTPDPGWTVFNPIQGMIYSPYGLTMYNDGRPRVYPNTYTADLMSQLTVRYIKRFSAARNPFFIWTSHVVPHGMRVDGRGVFPVPAPRHRRLYPNAVPPSFSSPAFNEADVSDKPFYVRRTEKRSRLRLVTQHLARIRSLRSVDDQVRATVEALRNTGELRNTYLFFISDNGFLLGQHRLTGKNVPYEPSLKVPLLVRGPGIPAGVIRRQTYGMVDLAPTFVDLAHATPRRIMDGRSMMSTLRFGAPGYRRYLIQAGTNTQKWWWRGVRSRRYVYVRYASGFEELYDRSKDRAQLRNVARRPAYRRVRAEYAAHLAHLKSCRGATCSSE